MKILFWLAFSSQVMASGNYDCTSKERELHVSVRDSRAELYKYGLKIDLKCFTATTSGILVKCSGNGGEDIGEFNEIEIHANLSGIYKWEKARTIGWCTGGFCPGPLQSRTELDCNQH